MKRYLVILGGFLAALTFADHARADECMVSRAINGGSVVSCFVSGTTASGSPGDVLGQFTLPEIDPALGQPLVVNASFGVTSPNLSGTAPMDRYVSPTLFLHPLASDTVVLIMDLGPSFRWTRLSGRFNCRRRLGWEPFFQVLYQTLQYRSRFLGHSLPRLPMEVGSHWEETGPAVQVN